MTKAAFRIGVYVLTKNAKQTYSIECYDIRLNAEMCVVCDILRRAGYTNIDYCSQSTVQDYDAVLFSVTSDCDWWPFVAERRRWRPGRYKVLVGGQGVLNVRPFLGFVDYFQLGRCEEYLVDLMDAVRLGFAFESANVIAASSFSLDKVYRIAQATGAYPYAIKLPNGDTYEEDDIGCNHKCLFCGYTWHRKHTSRSVFTYRGLWKGTEDRERAIIDLDNGCDIDFGRLRTTAIDGLSERLLVAVNKRITREMLRRFLAKAMAHDKPHQIKIYNIIGYPTETAEDWQEFLDDVRSVDDEFTRRSDKQMSLLLHSTPFRAMPATPLACEPMRFENYRGAVAATLGGGRYRGNIFYRGNACWCVESMGTESLPTVAMSAIVWRGTESDARSFSIVADNLKKFSGASAAVKLKTLMKMFPLERLFARHSPEELPTRNILTYCAVERMWNRSHFGRGREEAKP